MNNKLSHKARVWHRYLGFFLAGIMAVYAISGVILIFRDTDFLKKETIEVRQIAANLPDAQIGKSLEARRFEVEKTEGQIVYFKNGQYNRATGEATLIRKELPYVLGKMTHLHKSKSSEPLFFLNIAFGIGLLFFVVSAFYMFMPGTTIFRKGLYFTLGGIVLTLVLLFI